MTVLHFTIKINATPEKVWDVLWTDATYRKWTAVFSEESHAISDWNEGSTIQFIGPGNNGMYGIIQKKIPNTQMVFKHLGELKNGVQDPKEWGNALESYFLNGLDGGTELNVELDTTDNFKEYFTNTFPKALEMVKQITEQLINR